MVYIIKMMIFQFFLQIMISLLLLLLMMMFLSVSIYRHEWLIDLIYITRTSRFLLNKMLIIWTCFTYTHSYTCIYTHIQAYTHTLMHTGIVQYRVYLVSVLIYVSMCTILQYKYFISFHCYQNYLAKLMKDITSSLFFFI